MAPIAARLIRPHGVLRGASFSSRGPLGATTNDNSGGAADRGGGGGGGAGAAMTGAGTGGGDAATTGGDGGGGGGAGTGTRASAFVSRSFADSLSGSKLRMRRRMPSATFRYFCGLSRHGKS